MNDLFLVALTLYEGFFDDPFLVALGLYCFVRFGVLVIRVNRKREEILRVSDKTSSILSFDLSTLPRHPTILGALTAVWAFLNTDVKTILMMEVW